MIKSLLIISLLICTQVHARISPKLKVNSGHKIKVRIAKNLNHVIISGVGISRQVIRTRSIKRYKGHKKIKINCRKLRSAKAAKPQYLASIKSTGGLLTFDKQQYLGQLHVVTSANGRSCDLVNEIDLDNYLATLLAKEMNASWPIEALKAQAVAARTYALHHMMKSGIKNNLYDLESSEKHQVSGSFKDLTARTMNAAQSTSGQVLTNNFGNLVPAFFHASCGGSTLQPSDVWANQVRGYKTVSCGYCKKKKNWDSKITKKRFTKFLKWAMKKEYIKKQKISKNLHVYPDKKSNTVLYIKNGRKKINLKKSLFRRYFGRVEFPSNNFYIVDAGRSGIQFVGKGNGHGVGLCQVGSLGLATKGMGHKNILAHYFPKLNILKLY